MNPLNSEIIAGSEMRSPIELGEVPTSTSKIAATGLYKPDQVKSKEIQFEFDCIESVGKLKEECISMGTQYLSQVREDVLKIEKLPSLEKAFTDPDWAHISDEELKGARVELENEVSFIQSKPGKTSEDRDALEDKISTLRELNGELYNRHYNKELNKINELSSVLSSSLTMHIDKFSSCQSSSQMKDALKGFTGFVKAALSEIDEVSRPYEIPSVDQSIIANLQKIGALIMEVRDCGFPDIERMEDLEEIQEIHQKALEILQIEETEVKKTQRLPLSVSRTSLTSHDEEIDEEEGTNTEEFSSLAPSDLNTRETPLTESGSILTTPSVSPIPPVKSPGLVGRLRNTVEEASPKANS